MSAAAPIKQARIIRHPSTVQGTPGRLLLGDDEISCIELPWRDNQREVSCIPAGTYLCRPVVSIRFGQVFEVLDVPGRSAILIHAGNFGGDAELGWTTDLRGCIAPAMRIGRLVNLRGQQQLAGCESRSALRRLMDWADGSPFELDVSWGPH